MASSPDQTILHASAVAVEGQGILILGESGSGKSGLALTLMAQGATLVSDDRVVMTRQGGDIRMTSPDTIRGQIEARGVGILTATHCEDIPLSVAVIMDEMETDRLPPRRSKNFLGISIPILHNTGNTYFAPSVLQYVKAGLVPEQGKAWG